MKEYVVDSKHCKSFGLSWAYRHDPPNTPMRIATLRTIYTVFLNVEKTGTQFAAKWFLYRNPIAEMNLSPGDSSWEPFDAEKLMRNQSTKIGVRTE